jgi:hypothetical protein
MAGILLQIGGLLVLILTFWWEHNLIKASVTSAVDAAFDGTADQAKIDEMIKKYELERTMMEWLRVVGAIAMLVGLIWNWL